MQFLLLWQLRTSELARLTLIASPPRPSKQNGDGQGAAVFGVGWRARSARAGAMTHIPASSSRLEGELPSPTDRARLMLVPMPCSFWGAEHCSVRSSCSAACMARLQAHALLSGARAARCIGAACAKVAGMCCTCCAAVGGRPWNCPPGLVLAADWAILLCVR